MKRRKPLDRRTPLTPGEPLEARSGLRRATPLRPVSPSLSRGPVKPRCAEVTAAEREARRVVTARSGGLCEGCGQAAATDWSHRIGRGVGGPWCPSNGLHLCRACHGVVGERPVFARDWLGWRLESTDDPGSCPALLARFGWVLLGVDGSVVRVDRAA